MSSCESLILSVRNYSKVETFGENSYGVIDYGNMRWVKFPCLPYELYYPISKSTLLPEFSADKDGIAPEKELDKNKDWLQEVVDILEKGR
jgi:hypothetical protein